MGEKESPPGEPLPSLIQRLHLPRGVALRAIGAALLAVLALVAIVTGLLGRQARRQAVALGEVVAARAAMRDADRRAAGLFADPPLGDELAAVAAHLPPETRLASAARDEAGALIIAIDSADPDALRQTLRADPWFAAFQERGQNIGEGGAIRVTFRRTR
ncbi:hypothetical protein FHS31_001345 [Sphingomonas vulcanisoli]|uniref:Uncharacterized protein n=1 Tax=Sphingomonas vulcanisoli TaxID=1658060 RepID=A0ABX0TVD6_9SPHN|nr:hypothetical protein [Sphingomonas vulcanisoli]NIJ07735.1 hypothetical protein [Sphingomonas vulcanisoli]